MRDNNTGKTVGFYELVKRGQAIFDRIPKEEKKMKMSKAEVEKALAIWLRRSVRVRTYTDKSWHPLSTEITEIKAGIENRNTRTDRLGSAVLPQVQKSYYQNVAQREDMRPQQPCSATAPSPIKTAIELLESRVGHLQDVTGRLLIALQPVTRNTDDSCPAETCKAVEGNSTLNIDINALATRVESIAVTLQLQIDRLEV